MKPFEVLAEFPGEPSSAGQARRFVDATLRTWQCDALLEVATLLVSELVSNAVLHAGTNIRVVLRMDGRRLRVEVQDGNARLPARKHYSALSATGRGLMLVERMAAEWGVDASGGGKSVWFELDSTAPPPGPEFGAFAFGDLDLEGLDDLASERTGRDPEHNGGGPDGHQGLRALVLNGRP